VVKDTTVHAWYLQPERPELNAEPHQMLFENGNEFWLPVTSFPRSQAT
jgi:hypothetical protein